MLAQGCEVGGMANTGRSDVTGAILRLCIFVAACWVPVALFIGTTYDKWHGRKYA